MPTGGTAILQGFEITEGIGTQTGNGRYGGAIANSEHLTISDTVVGANRAQLGGGVFNLGTMTPENGAVIDNKPDNCIGTDACLA